jgi:hypothetical protein
VRRIAYQEYRLHVRRRVRRSTFEVRRRMSSTLTHIHYTLTRRRIENIFQDMCIHRTTATAELYRKFKTKSSMQIDEALSPGDCASL